MSKGTRRLAALMFTDMVGYSAVARKNEQLAKELVDEHRAISRKALFKYHGRERDTAGDGFFLEFPSAVQAVECAMEIQTLMRDRDRQQTSDRIIKLRIGIHLGDIITSEDDLYGNGVNIAARVEPLANPGGICITRQIYDQVANLPAYEFKRLGWKTLKNIKGGAEVFQVVMPWEQNVPKIKTRVFKSWPSYNEFLLGALFAFVFGVLAVASLGILRPLKFIYLRHQTAYQTVDLSGGWSYRLQNSEPWQPFDTKSTWQYADLIQGNFQLKKDFIYSGKLTNPAIVLGVIPDSHRLYLNGQLVGGSASGSDLAFYAFDPRLLKTNNELVVNAKAKPNLNPGLNMLPEAGAFLGEFADVRQAVLKNQLMFHLFRNMCFFLSFLMFLACSIFAIFQSSKRQYYFYCSLILLLGSLQLAYYSLGMNFIFDYPFIRFIKVLGLCLTPFFLSSVYLYKKRNAKWEFLNNVGASLFIAIASVTLFSHMTPPSRFSAAYNWVTLVASLYTGATIVVATFSLFKAIRRRNIKNLILSFDSAFIFFEAWSLFSLMVSFKLGLTALVLSPALKSAMGNISVAMPFLFSLFVMGMVIQDYIVQSRLVKGKQERDELMLDLIRLFYTSKDVSQTISVIQEKLCRFLRVRRSTLYVIEEGEKNRTLVAAYTVGHLGTNLEIKKTVNLDEGIVGFVIQNETPLLIENIHKDPRFSSGANSEYRTGSCMVFPLVFDTHLVGVLTLADKESDTAFTQEDFSIALEISFSLGLLLDNRQLHQALKHPTLVS
jgi:class 3 adenylate cyclase/putative methionine-R-sulfoxide reductase with GAF domain